MLILIAFWALVTVAYGLSVRFTIRRRGDEIIPKVILLTAAWLTASIGIPIMIFVAGGGLPPG